MNNLVISFLLFFLAQSMIWFQTNGQFMWPFFKDHPIIIAFTLGSAAGWVFFNATSYAVQHFNGLLWPGRFIGFGTGMIVFTILTYLIMGENINAKTLVSLMLALIIICLQIFWK